MARPVNVGHDGRLSLCSKAFRHPRWRLQSTGSFPSREKPTDRKALSVATNSVDGQNRSPTSEFGFKQWGGTRKKKAERELDGRTWEEMPALALTMSF
jgi:protein gp37